MIIDSGTWRHAGDAFRRVFRVMGQDGREVLVSVREQCDTETQHHGDTGGNRMLGDSQWEGDLYSGSLRPQQSVHAKLRNALWEDRCQATLSILVFQC